MGRYKNKANEALDDSEYESDGGTTYHPVTVLGSGDYARARLFQSGPQLKPSLTKNPNSSTSLDSSPALGLNPVSKPNSVSSPSPSPSPSLHSTPRRLRRRPSSSFGFSKAVVVLSSVKLPEDKGEASIKQRFFKTVYTDKQTHLFNTKPGYRLVVPYVPYVPYEKLEMDNPEFQRVLFSSAIDALHECHQKGMIMI